MITMELAPDTDGLINWLRNMYHSAPFKAIELVQAGWPTVTKAHARLILTRVISLDEALYELQLTEDEGEN